MFELFERGRAESGDLTELIRKMLNAAVPHPESDLAQRQLSVDKKFLGPLNSLQDRIPFDRHMFHRGEEGAQGVVVLPQLAGDCHRKRRHLLLPLTILADESDNRRLDPVDRLGALVVQQFKPVPLQYCTDHGKVGRSRIRDNDGVSELDVAHFQPGGRQLFPHDSDAPVADHILDPKRRRLSGAPAFCAAGFFFLRQGRSRR